MLHPSLCQYCGGTPAAGKGLCDECSEIKRRTEDAGVFDVIAYAENRKSWCNLSAQKVYSAAARSESLHAWTIGNSLPQGHGSLWGHFEKLPDSEIYRGRGPVSVLYKLYGVREKKKGWLSWFSPPQLKFAAIIFPKNEGLGFGEFPRLDPDQWSVVYEPCVSDRGIRHHANCFEGLGFIDVASDLGMQARSEELPHMTDAEQQAARIFYEARRNLKYRSGLDPFHGQYERVEYEELTAKVHDLVDEAISLLS